MTISALQQYFQQPAVPQPQLPPPALPPPPSTPVAQPPQGAIIPFYPPPGQNTQTSNID